jgi:hypothetical protein
MKLFGRVVSGVLVAAVFIIVAAGVSQAAEPQRHVVGENEIQATIDHQAGQADADRQTIQLLLQREDVKKIAGSAGLDVERASAAAAVLSGPSLEKLASQAREINADLAGGSNSVVISVTALLLIVIIIILLAN